MGGLYTKEALYEQGFSTPRSLPAHLHSLSANFGECYTHQRNNAIFNTVRSRTAMYSALNGYLRIPNPNGFLPSANHFIKAAALVLLLSVAASAYTVVLRSGRRIEIPASFTVTKLTLTYESAPGINITLLMATIDVQATERANNEPAGALLKRAEQQAVIKTASRQARTPRRELTKQDIEKGREARQRSEQEYERRRVELGLPSLEEMRRRT
jgi:hypothetical protein